MTFPILGTPDFDGHWIEDAVHRGWLAQDATAQLSFFRQSLRADGGFDVLNYDGTAIDGPQELHTTTRLVHSFALAKQWGAADCDDIISAGLAFLWTKHRDADHGGYVWSVLNGEVDRGIKLAYGHVFVLLAAASAKAAGHADADRLLADVDAIIDEHYWDEDAGLLRDEFNRDWTPFSDYRGYNANMHGTEAFLAAYEATGNAKYLERAGRILDFFTKEIAPAHDYRLPEHYTLSWEPDLAYAGDPMFRPKGTTPGHSFELGRVLIQWWDLSGRPEGDHVVRARKLIETALADAWQPDGGFAYTLNYGGGVLTRDRYWWPVTEAIGAMATLIKTDPQDQDEDWYRKLWTVAAQLFIDHERGGWFPELDDSGAHVAHQFAGKPDIYHALQADLLPLANGVSRPMTSFG